MSIFKKCKDYYKQIKYAKKDAQTYVDEDIKRKFHLQNQKELRLNYPVLLSR